MGLRISSDLRICAADDCDETFEFDPANPLKEYHSIQCQRRMRMRRLRNKNRTDGPSGGGRQRRLFPNPPKAAKRVRIPEPVLFPDDGASGLHATIGGAVEYGQNGSVSDKNRYSVKSDRRKAPQPVSQPEKVQAAAA